jgi:hypothetical protein
MAIKTFTKDPDARLDYSIDWETWLDGDTIVSSSSGSDWELPSGISASSSPAHSKTTTTTTAWITGGTAGEEYVLTNTIHTDAGRINDASLRIIVRHSSS